MRVIDVVCVVVGVVVVGVVVVVNDVVGVLVAELVSVDVAEVVISLHSTVGNGHSWTLMFSGSGKHSDVGRCLHGPLVFLKQSWHISICDLLRGSGVVVVDAVVE